VEIMRAIETFVAVEQDLNLMIAGAASCGW
jgi:hypothetical protein